MSESIAITSKLPVEQRAALEQLLFFNVHQHRVRLGIQQSIETYGVPEIYEQDGSLRIRVGDLAGVQNLFAVSKTGRLLGVAVFVRAANCVVLHLGVAPRRAAASQTETNTPVLLKLMHEIRSTAPRRRGMDRIELVYKHAHSLRVPG